MKPSVDQLNPARLLAAASPQIGAWIHALPIPSLGVYMDAETIKIATRLRLGERIMEPHHCRCGAMMVKQGHHGLSCRETKGRYSRPAALNVALKRTLATGGVLPRLGPIGLTSNDERRPDGLNLSAFTHCKSLCWTATCADTFCSTALSKTTTSAGAAAAEAEESETPTNTLAKRTDSNPWQQRQRAPSDLARVSSSPNSVGR